jgi:hypothetical protein
MFDADHSVTDIMHSLAAAFQKLPVSAVKSVSSADHRQNKHVRRNIRLSISLRLVVDFVYVMCTIYTNPISYLIYRGQAGGPK